MSNSEAFLALREAKGRGEVSTFNSVTTKLLQEVNSVTSTVESIAGAQVCAPYSDYLQAVTTFETQSDHLQEHTSGQILKQVQDDYILRGRIRKVGCNLLHQQSKNVGGAHLRTEKKQVAFTLAEVLITLGIIGIIAAMTLPTLLSNYRKQVAETRVAKFYSTMNQAIQRAENDYGDKKNWGEIGNGFVVDEDGNVDKTKSVPQAWFDKYLKPYMNIADERVNGNGNVVIYYPDGSLALFAGTGIIYYLNKKDYIEMVKEDGTVQIKQPEIGARTFSFFFAPNRKELIGHYNKGIEPYTYGWDGTIENLYNGYYGCYKENTNLKAYCTKLIQMNGWKIPKDYPLKF